MATNTNTTPIRAHFRHVRDTKGAVLYEEYDPITGATRKMNDPHTKIGSLYIRKASLPDRIPNVVTVTLEF